MTRSATGNLRASIRGAISNALDNTGRTASSQVGDASLLNINFVDGVAANQINRLWEVVDFALAENDDVEINLNTFAGWDIGAGLGNDAVGQPMDLEEVVVIAIVNTSTAIAGQAGGPFLEVYPSISSGWTAIGSHKVAQGGALGANGSLVKCNPGEPGFDVLPGTADRITLKAVGGDVTFTAVVFGRNDDDESSSTSSMSTSSSSRSTQSSSSQSSSFSSSSSSSSSS